MRAAREDRWVAVRIGGAVALFLLLVCQGRVTVADGSSMLAVTHSFVHHASLNVPAPLGVPGRDGLYYSKYGLLLSLLSVVPVLLAQPAGLLTGRLDLVEAAFASSLMPLVAGALAASLFLLGRRLDATRPAAALVATGSVLGTYLLPYGRDFFTEPLVALGLVVMVERVIAGREAQAAAGLALAVLARPQSAAFAPLLLAFMVARGSGLLGLVRTLPPLAIAAVITIAYNLVRFGDALEFGYDPPVDPGFTTPLLNGTRGLLFSPEKSIVLFAPAIVLVPFALVALWRRQRWTAALAGAIFAVSFVLAATWWSWMGGWSWGPRLVIPGVAVLLATLGPWIGDRAGRLRLTGALFALGFALSFAAVLAPTGAQLIDRAPGTDGPQLVRQVTLLPHLASRSIGAVRSPDKLQGDYRRYLAVWQVGLVRQIGLPGLLLALAGTAIIGTALCATARPLARDLQAR